MVQIANKTAPDPVANLHVVDAYMRWALQAAEEVVGKDGLAVVLRNAGMDKFVDNYPPENLEVSGRITYGDYANLSAGLLTFFGRPGKGMVMRIGREASKKAIEHQSGIFNLATITAAKMMPTATQIKMGLSALVGGFRVLQEKAGEEYKASIEDDGDHYALVVETCPVCAGKQADTPICWLIEAAIEESSRQIFGKHFDVTQTQCRAMGATACIWHVPKQPA
jgi:predicted hydrocarbon binding protein